MDSILTKVILGGTGVGLALMIAARLMPNETLRAWGQSLGKFISNFGMRKLGKASWESVEGFLENSTSVFLEGLKAGLDIDDAEPEQKQEETKNG